LQTVTLNLPQEQVACEEIAPHILHFIFIPDSINYHKTSSSQLKKDSNSALSQTIQDSFVYFEDKVVTNIKAAHVEVSLHSVIKRLSYEFSTHEHIADHVVKIT